MAKLSPNELVTSVQKLVAAIAKTMSGIYKQDFREAYQIGMAAVTEAAHRWTPEGEATFATYAHRRATGALQDAFITEQNRRRQAQAILRAITPGLDLTEVGDPFQETEPQRADRLKEAIKGAAAAAVIGLTHRPQNPEDLFLTAEHAHQLKSQIAAALERLDPIDRELLWETMTEDDVSIVEAGRRRGLGEEDTRWRVRRSKEKLQKELRGLRGGG